jgi:hypothetical protein
MRITGSADVRTLESSPKPAGVDRTGCAPARREGFGATEPNVDDHGHETGARQQLRRGRIEP